MMASVSGMPDGSKARCVPRRTDRELPADYLVAMKTSSTTEASQPVDLALAVRSDLGDTYELSKVLLARVDPDGTLELLTAAWGKALGYGRREFVGKTLRQLMRASIAATAPIVAAILDERNMDPIDLTLRTRAGAAKRLRLHRRYDAYTRKMFILAEETSAGEGSYLRDHPAVRADREARGAR
jgi:hypothetical protein